MKIVPFADEHLDAATEMLAARHVRHREAEPLLPTDVDFRAQLETEWSVDGASGVISAHGYLFGRPDPHGLTVGIGGHASPAMPNTRATSTRRRRQRGSRRGTARTWSSSRRATERSSTGGSG
jgi:hypothetical protein